MVVLFYGKTYELNGVDYHCYHCVAVPYHFTPNGASRPENPTYFNFGPMSELLEKHFLVAHSRYSIKLICLVYLYLGLQTY